jgi:hypothetical protein
MAKKIENKKIFVQKDKIALPLTFSPSFPHQFSLQPAQAFF